MRRLPALHLPQPDGAVKSLLCKIGQLPGQLELDLDARVALLKAGQGRPQPQTTEAEGRRQPDQPRRLGLALLQFGLKRREALQQYPRALAYGLALGGRADAPGGALKQALAQPGFQSGQPLGHHGRRHVEAERGSRQTAVVTHGQYQFQIVAVHSFL